MDPIEMDRKRSPAAQKRLNEKLVSRIATRDHLASMECAYVGYTFTLNSPDVKRLYLRFFERMALSVNVMTVLGTRYMPDEKRGMLDTVVTQRIEQARKVIDEKVDEADALLQAHGITGLAKFLAPMQVEVRVTSPIMQEYLDLLERSDRFLGMVNTLWIRKVIALDRMQLEAILVRKTTGKPAALARQWEAFVWKRVRESQDEHQEGAGAPSRTSVSRTIEAIAETITPVGSEDTDNHTPVATHGNGVSGNGSKSNGSKAARGRKANGASAPSPAEASLAPLSQAAP